MLKKTVLFLLSITSCTAMLIICLYSLFQIRLTSNPLRTNEITTYRQFKQENNLIAYAALPSISGMVDSVIQSGDARGEILYQYLKKRNSPLAPFADHIVQMSEINDIDFRLPVAIAECESNLCEDGKFPQDSYNCWGYGIHSQGTLKFSSFDEGIDTVIKGLKKFQDQGYLSSIDKLMSLYTPPSVALGGPWAKCVTQFMDELK